jgi:hypothetical protein
MRSPRFSSSQIEDREACYLDRSEEATPQTRLAQTFDEFAGAFAGRDDGDMFTVDATLSLPHGQVPITVPVEGVMLRPYTMEVVADVDGVPPPLQPLFPGHRLALDGWSMTGWTYTTGGKTVRSAELLAGEGNTSSKPVAE